MQSLEFIQGYFNPKQLKLPLSFEIKIPFDSEARENLQSNLGIELRMQRSAQVEGAFGVIKGNAGFRRFNRRGIENVKFEFILIAIGYNLSKLHKKKFRSN